MQRVCLTLDLKDDPALIDRYVAHHAAGQVWPEVVESIVASGVQEMEIYLLGQRLFMVIEATADFSLTAKNQSDATNAPVQAWEALMDTYQQRLPCAGPGEKWIPMQCIFRLSDCS